MFQISVSKKLYILSTISSFTMYLGILLGCIPLHSPSLQLKIEGFYKVLWKNFTFLYALIMAGLQPVLFIYMPQGLPEFIPGTVVPLSEKIINYTAFVVWATGEILRRIVYLTCCKNVFKLIRKLDEQQTSVLDMCTDSTRARRSLASFFAIGFTCAYGIIAGIQETMLALDDKYMTHGHWIMNIVGALVHTGWFCSRLFATGLALIAGQQLIEHYSIVMEDLSSSQENELQVVASEGGGMISVQSLIEKGVHTNGAATHGHNNSDKDWTKKENWCDIEKIKEMHANFDLYGNVVGFLVLVALAENGMIGLVYLYKTITYYEVESLFAVLEHYMSMMLIAHLGQTMKDTVNDVRQNMRLILAKTELAMLEDESGKFSDQFETKISILQYIVRWKWNFRACDMLDIGYTLFSVIAANTTMLVMFMFSLKISEQTAI